MTVIITRPVRRRPRFHDLEVGAVDRLTDDAVAVSFRVPAELRDDFSFRAGQHLTVRRPDDPDDVRRSYSICSTPADLASRGLLRIGVKVIPGGQFSAYAAAELGEGDLVQVLPPLGNFTTAFEPSRVAHYAAIVAGSGITPVLSLVATALATEPGSRFTVVYGNRYVRSVMFAEELADLKDRYPTRLHLVHVLSREPQEAELLSGRLSEQRLTALFGKVLDPSTVDEWFLCGPYGLVLAAREAIAVAGVPDRAVHTELFHVSESPAPVAEPVESGEVEVGILLDGRTSSFTMGRGERVLDAALRVRPELPYACRGGVCSTCRAKVLEGEVTMARNFALEPDEIAAGYVLTCQSSPVTDSLMIDYDA